jgi:hypothetical protein
MSEQQATRRAVLTGAGGIAAAGALSTAALALPAPLSRSPSPELIAYRRLRQDYVTAQEAAITGYNAWLRENSHYPDYDALLRALFTRETNVEAHAALDRMRSTGDDEWSKQENLFDAARDAILARPVTTNQQLAEVAEVVRTENRWEGGEEGEGTNETYPATSEIRALFAAIETLASAA